MKPPPKARARRRVAAVLALGVLVPVAEASQAAAAPRTTRRSDAHRATRRRAHTTTQVRVRARSGRARLVVRELTAPPPAPSAPPADPAGAVLAEARRQLGKPYRYGGSGPGSFDCSGFTSWAWRAGGVELPRTSRTQFGATKRVARQDLQPGDLVFFGRPISHVGLYVGDGQMIHAPSWGKTVSYASIDRGNYVGAGRPVIPSASSPPFAPPAATTPPAPGATVPPPNETATPPAAAPPGPASPEGRPAS